jgi:3-methyladenine DNA glycosylase AlkD
MKIADKIIQQIKLLENKQDAAFLQRFFKTGPGQYGEGDHFLGVRNPEIRKIAKQYKEQVSDRDILSLIKSDWHEVRLCALVIMNLLMESNKIPTKRKNKLIEIYLNNISIHINNWDLVDISAPHILGKYLLEKTDRSILYELSSGDLWQKRVALISTFAFIKNNDLFDAIRLCKKLMYEQHDLLHKAVGWTMREIGKKNKDELIKLLDVKAQTMPRTALRYSIEKLPEIERKHYLQLKNIK